MVETLSLPLARRIALAAQGLADPRPSRTEGWSALRRVVDRTALLQIDSVNVLTRAHYLPAFSRLGAYRRQDLESAAWGRPRRLFEYWAHEASLLPLALQPLLRWRMARAERGVGVWAQLRPFAGDRRAEADAVLARITTEGPLCAADLENSRGSGGWWGWSDAKSTLEWLFWAGRITTRTRRNTFERVYDLAERVFPRSILETPTPSEQDAHRALLALAGRALGIATASDLRDYFRMSPHDTKPRLDELVESGELTPVIVKGWTEPAYLHREARRPRRAQAAALLAPFDPLIWYRARTERLFGVRFRLEIYTPADKRLHGYYVLPFLLGDRIVARVDLKADRTRSVLMVKAAHSEGAVAGDVVDALSRELRCLSGWLALDRVEVGRDGNLAAALGDAFGVPLSDDFPVLIGTQSLGEPLGLD